MSNHSHLCKTLKVGLKVPRRCLQEVPGKSARNHWMEDGGSRFIVQLSSIHNLSFVVNKKKKYHLLCTLVYIITILGFIVLASLSSRFTWQVMKRYISYD